MKKLCYIAILLNAPFFLNAQNGKARKAEAWKPERGYISFKAGSTISGMAGYLHFRNQWVAFVSSEGGSIKSKDAPRDYRPSSGTIFFIPYTGSIPEDSHHSYSIGMGRVVTPASHKGWLMLTAGISMSKYERVIFTKRQATSADTGDDLMSLFGFSGTSSNYNTSIKEESGLGATLGIQANLNLFRFMGLHGGASANLSSSRIIIGANLGLNIGIMRPSKKSIGTGK